MISGRNWNVEVTKSIWDKIDSRSVPKRFQHDCGTKLKIPSASNKFRKISHKTEEKVVREKSFDGMVSESSRALKQIFRINAFIFTYQRSNVYLDIIKNSNCNTKWICLECISESQHYHRNGNIISCQMLAKHWWWGGLFDLVVPRCSAVCVCQVLETSYV